MSVAFDPTSAEFSADPYKVYAALRERDEPYYFEPEDIHLLSRFSEVEAIARDPRMVRSAEGFLPAAEIKRRQRLANWHDMPNHERFVQFSLLESDGAIHDRLRRLVMKHMSRRFVESQRAMIQSFVTNKMAELRAEKSDGLICEIDFIEDIASHIPGHIIGSVLGVPAKDCAQLRVWSENVVQFFDVNRTEAHKALAETATTEFYHYLQALIAERQQTPRSDLVSALISERDQGAMSETELISTCMLILMAGHGSTIDVLGSGMYLLLCHPEQTKKLRSNPELMPGAVQEMFRIESPLPYFHRYASEPVTVMGKLYPTGTRFGLLYGAANRDPSVFTDPNSFIIDRAPNRHIAFARGAHLCLGNHLSRIDMEEIFTALLSQTSEIELCDHPVYRPGLSTRGMDHLKIRLIYQSPASN